MARRAARKGQRTRKPAAASNKQAKFPRHSVERALRVARAIIEQNAGKPCTDREAAHYLGVGFNGPFRVELSSAQKYGFLDRPTTGKVGITERARQAIRPQNPGDDVEALRDAVQDAPDIADVYAHYRGKICLPAIFLTTH